MDLKDFVESAAFLAFASFTNILGPLITIAMIILLITREVAASIALLTSRRFIRVLDISIVPITVCLVAIVAVKLLLTFF
jgi:hypothetical protein